MTAFFHWTFKVHLPFFLATEILYFIEELDINLCRTITESNLGVLIITCGSLMLSVLVNGILFNEMLSSCFALILFITFCNDLLIYIVKFLKVFNLVGRIQISVAGPLCEAWT